MQARIRKNNECKPEQEKTMKQQCARYTIINEDLYRRGYSAPYWNASPVNGPSTFWSRSTRESVEITLERGRWPLRSWGLTTTDRPSRVTVPSAWRNVPSARSLALSTTQGRKSWMILSPYGRLPFGGWTLSVPLRQEKDRPNSSWWESTTLWNGSWANPLHPSRQKMCKISYGGALFADSTFCTR